MSRMRRDLMTYVDGICDTAPLLERKSTWVKINWTMTSHQTHIWYRWSFGFAYGLGIGPVAPVSACGGRKISLFHTLHSPITLPSRILPPSRKEKCNCVCRWILLAVTGWGCNSSLICHNNEPISWSRPFSGFICSSVFMFQFCLFLF